MIQNEKFLTDCEVWEIENESSHICLGTLVLVPLLSERGSVPTDNFHRRQEFGYLEPSSKNNNVKFRVGTVLSNYTFFLNLFDAFLYKYHIRLVKAVEVVRVEDATLTAWS
jgi:hypothetical protein